MNTYVSYTPTLPIRRALVVLLLSSSLGAGASFGASSSGAGAGSRPSPGAATDADVSRQDRTFATKAAEMGLMEVAAARLALTRAQNGQVREFAQTMLSDHQKANSQLAAIATRRGIELPEGVVASVGAGAAMGGSGGTTSSTRPSSGSSTAGSGGAAGADSAAAGSPGTSSGTTTTDRSATAASQRMNDTMPGMERTAGLPAEHRRKLEQLGQKSGAEFDQAYTKQMVEDHREAIALFEKAARECEDPELKQFAAAQLPTLQQHGRHAQELAGSVGREGTGARSGGANTGSAPGGVRSGSTPGGSGPGSGAGDTLPGGTTPSGSR